MTIKNVTVLGAGALGSQIAFQTAYSGFAVSAYDVNDDLLAKAKQSFESLAAHYEREVHGAAVPLMFRTGFKHRAAVLLNWLIAFIGHGRPSAPSPASRVSARLSLTANPTRSLTGKSG